MEQALADQNTAQEATDALAQVSVGRGREVSSSDIFQIVRKRERFCNDMTTLNEYVKAYFANVHPLLPVLHKEAFLKLYRLYGLKALADNIQNNQRRVDSRWQSCRFDLCCTSSWISQPRRNPKQDGRGR